MNKQQEAATPRNIEYHRNKVRLRHRDMGRNVQELVDRMMAENEIRQQTKMAQEIIRIISALTNGMKDSPDPKRKMWEILFRLSGYQLSPKVTHPYIFEVPEPLQAIPRAQYTGRGSRFKQYGRNVELMIDKAIKMPLGNARNRYVSQIAGIMKQFLIQYANHGQNNEKVVMEHLQILSNGEINLRPEDFRVQQQQQQPPPPPRPQHNAPKGNAPAQQPPKPAPTQQSRPNPPQHQQQQSKHPFKKPFHKGGGTPRKPNQNQKFPNNSK
jgi:hypothetical protein